MPNKRHSQGKQKYTLILAIILLSLILRLLFLSTPSIRGDEGGTFYLTSSPLSEYFSNTTNDVHPPLSYLITHFFLLFGKTEFLFRLPSALFGAASTYLIYLLGKKLFDEKTALIAALILAISQFNIRYAQISRMYSLVTFFCLLSTYFYWKLIHEKPKTSTSILYIISSTLLIYSHYYGALVLFFHGIHTLLFKKNIRRFFIHALIICLLFLPWLPTFIQQMAIKTQYETSFMGNTIHLSFTTFGPYNVLVQAGNFIFQFLAGHITFALHPLFLLIVLLTLAALVMTAIGLRKDYTKEPVIFLAIMLIGNMIIIFSLLYFEIITVLPYARYLIYVSPFLFLLVSFAITRYPKKIAYPAIIAIILINIFSLGIYYKYDRESGDFRTLAHKLNGSLYSTLSTQTYNFAYYYDEPIILLPENKPFIKEKYEDLYSQRIQRIHSCTTLPNATSIIIVTTPSLHDLYASCPDRTIKEASFKTYQDIWGREYKDIGYIILAKN